VFTGLILFVTQIYALIVFLIMVFIDPLLALLIPGILLATGGITVALHDPLKMNKLRRRKEKMDRQKLESILNLRKAILEQLPR
jgi:ABC-type bacteriocin/lantibiotic exporter with double-glycine peptidase domain